MIDAEGVIGDAVCNGEHHGGRDQAIYVEGVADAGLVVERSWGAGWSPVRSAKISSSEGLDNREVAVGDRLHSRPFSPWK